MKLTIVPYLQCSVNVHQHYKAQATSALFWNNMILKCNVFITSALISKAISIPFSGCVYIKYTQKYAVFCSKYISIIFHLLKKNVWEQKIWCPSVLWPSRLKKQGHYANAVDCLLLSREQPSIHSSRANANIAKPRTSRFWLVDSETGPGFDKQLLSKVEDDIQDEVDSVREDCRKKGTV